MGMALRIVGVAGSTMPLFIVRPTPTTRHSERRPRALLVTALGPIEYGYSEAERR
jgi:hypothetical protein